jgi:hypothetical protein
VRTCPPSISLGFNIAAKWSTLLFVSQPPIACDVFGWKRKKSFTVISILVYSLDNKGVRKMLKVRVNGFE